MTTSSRWPRRWMTGWRRGPARCGGWQNVVRRPHGGGTDSVSASSSRPERREKVTPFGYIRLEGFGRGQQIPRRPGNAPPGDGDPIIMNTSQISLLAAMILSTSVSSAAVIVGWDASGLSNFGASPLAATESSDDVTIGGLTRGSGVTAPGGAAANGWGGAGWTSTTSAAAISAGDFVTFSVEPALGFSASFSSLTLDYRRSGSGPDNGLIQFQIGSGSYSDITAFSYTSSASAGATLPSVDLSSVAALQNVSDLVTFRIVNYRVAAGGAAGGTWYVFNVGSDAGVSDLLIEGSINATPVPEPSTYAGFAGALLLGFGVWRRSRRS